jgi:hypothetical protein
MGKSRGSMFMERLVLHEKWSVLSQFFSLTLLDEIDKFRKIT